MMSVKADGFTRPSLPKTGLNGWPAGNQRAALCNRNPIGETMPRACSICNHEQREEIEKAIVAGMSYRNVAERFGTSATAVFRHKSHEDSAPENRGDISHVPENFRPHLFKPGQSGNPGGRPKKKPLTEELEKILQSTGRDPQKRTYAKRLMESAVKRAIKKDTLALREIWERAEGKVPQALTGAEGGPVQFEVSVIYGSVRNGPEAEDLLDADAQNAEVIDSEIIDEQ
jgi:Family of unknown function (DUF5681)